MVCTPEQPDRARRDPDRARRLPRAGARRTCWSCVDEAYVEFVADERRRRRRRDRAARTTTWSRRAPSPRPTAWPASGSGTPSRPAPIAAALRAVACRSASRASPRPRRSPRSRARTSCSSGSRPLVAERDRVVKAALADAGWSVPDAQGNFVWLALGERTADFAAAADEARHRGAAVRRRRGRGSPSARPTATTSSSRSRPASRVRRSRRPWRRRSRRRSAAPPTVRWTGRPAAEKPVGPGQDHRVICALQPPRRADAPSHRCAPPSGRRPHAARHPRGADPRGQPAPR